MAVGNKIGIEYSYLTEGSDKYLNLKVLDETWSGIETTYIFSDISEGLLQSINSKFCFDLSKLIVISSSCLGVCMNIINLAKDNNKNIKFKFNKEVMYSIKLTGIEKMVEVEEV